SRDGSRVTSGGAAALGLRLQEGIRELVVGPREAARVDRLPLAERRGVALDLVVRLAAGGLDLQGGALEGRLVLRRRRQVADERADRRVDRALDRRGVMGEHAATSVLDGREARDQLLVGPVSTVGV